MFSVIKNSSQLNCLVAGWKMRKLSPGLQRANYDAICVPQTTNKRHRANAHMSLVSYSGTKKVRRNSVAVHWIRERCPACPWPFDLRARWRCVLISISMYGRHHNVSAVRCQISFACKPTKIAQDLLWKCFLAAVKWKGYWQQLHVLAMCSCLCPNGQWLEFSVVSRLYRDGQWL